MKLLSFITATLLCTCVNAQIAVTGTNSPINIANLAPATEVDPGLTITSATPIPSFTVSISNFYPGDVLDINTTMPSGITANYTTLTGVLTITGSGSAADYQALLRAVRFRTTSLITTSRIVNFDALDGSYKLYNGHYYRFVSGGVSFTTAKANASASTLFGWQGYMVTIGSQPENDFVFNSLGKGWLGGSDEYSQINAAVGSTLYNNQAASEGKWYWIGGPEKGTQFSTVATAYGGRYANWASGEPNNDQSLEHYAENSNPNNGKWNDAQLGSQNLLMEYGGLEAGISVDLSHTRTIVMVATQLNTTASAVTYALTASAVSVDPAITAYSISTFNAGKVTISGNFRTGDALSYSGALPSGFTGSFNSTSGVLSFASSSAASISDWQTVFRMVKFQSSSTTIGDRTVTFSVGNQVAFSNGHFYEYISTASTWDNAKTAAEGKTYLGLNGYLATITSATENEFIRLKMNADAWTGASDAFGPINSATGATTYATQALSEGKWYWVTGPEKGTQMTTGNAPNGTSLPPVAGTAYNNWNTGEPNNSSSNENAGTIYASGTTAGKWNDLNNSSTLGYVVEYGGLASDPLLQLSSNRVIQINSVLPVNGLVFKAEADGNDVQLSWSTQSETNTKRFEVLHSADGDHYSVIATVDAAGNSAIEQHYIQVHRGPGSGSHYYKLRQYDIDGASFYSETRIVKFGADRLRLVPSVVTSGFRITGPGNFRSKMQILDASGRIVSQGSVSSQANTVAVDQLPAGAYFVELTGDDGRQVLRFVKK